MHDPRMNYFQSGCSWLSPGTGAIRTHACAPRVCRRARLHAHTRGTRRIRHAVPQADTDSGLDAPTFQRMLGSPQIERVDGRGAQDLAVEANEGSPFKS